MASRVQVVLEDDIDGSAAQSTVAFSLDGVEYEIDLSEANARALTEALTPYIEAGRRVSGRKTRRRAPAGGRSGGSDSAVDTASVRAWAHDQGIEVAARGRISADVIAMYRAANG